jgi:hypothetical protein
VRPVLMSILLLLSPGTSSVMGEGSAPKPAARAASQENVPLSATGSEDSISERNLREVQESFNKEFRSKSQDWSSSNLLQDLKNKTPQPDSNNQSEPHVAPALAEATTDAGTNASPEKNRVSDSTIPIAMICIGTIAGLIAVCALAQSRWKRPNGPIGTHRKITA